MRKVFAPPAFFVVRKISYLLFAIRICKIYQNINAIDAKSPSAAATYWSLRYWCITAPVWYNTAIDANTTIAIENQSPSWNPNNIEQTIIPSAINDAIVKNEPKYEKLFPDKKTYAVIPPESDAVKTPAWIIASGAIAFATKSKGKKIIASAKT